MNILGYIDKFGQYDFKQKIFNNVDALICVTLSYLNFEKYLKDDTNSSMAIKDISNDIINPLCAGEFTTFYNKKLIKKMRNSNRFSNIEIKYVRSVHNPENTIQFFAMTLIIPNTEPIICFRGTDLTLVGWKEDLLLGVSNVLPSHFEACKYIEYVSKLIKGKFRIGGHSKGGNISIYSSINSFESVQDRIRCVYNFDGPGFRFSKIFESNGYFKIKDRIVQIFPRDDVVGALFIKSENYYIIKAYGFSVMQHNPYNWIVEKDGDFKYIEKLDKRVNIRNRTMEVWLDNLEYDELALVIDSLIEVFGGINSNLVDFVKYFILKIIRYINLKAKYPKQKRIKLKKAIKAFKTAYKDSKKFYKNKHKEEKQYSI